MLLRRSTDTTLIMHLADMLIDAGTPRIKVGLLASKDRVAFQRLRV